MFCIKCGAEMPDGVQFCPKCGASAVHLDEQPQSFVQDAPEPQIPEVESTFVPTQQPYVPQPPAPAAPKPVPKKKKVWPIVLVCSLLALLAAAACVIFLVPSVHDAVFGVEELAFEESGITLSVGEKFDLTDLLDAGERSADDLRWSSDDKDVAAVKNGVVTAAAPGECRITVEDPEHDDVYDEIRVTVIEKVLEFDEEEIELEVGETVQLNDYLRAENVELNGAKWSISDGNVADWAENDHVIRAKDAGTAVVTVEADGLKAAIQITVEAKPEPEPEDFDADKALSDIRSWYYNPGGNDSLQKLDPGSGGWSYGREYLFHDGALVFAFVYDDSVQYRLYYNAGELFYVIDTAKNEYSGSDVDQFRYISDQAESDAQNYRP